MSLTSKSRNLAFSKNISDRCLRSFIEKPDVELHSLTAPLGYLTGNTVLPITFLGLGSFSSSLRYELSSQMVSLTSWMDAPPVACSSNLSWTIWSVKVRTPKNSMKKPCMSSYRPFKTTIPLMSVAVAHRHSEGLYQPTVSLSAYRMSPRLSKLPLEDFS